MKEKNEQKCIKKTKERENEKKKKKKDYLLHCLYE